MVEIELVEEHYAERPPKVEDKDGNCIVHQDGVAVFRPARLTTRREFKHFVANYIAPYLRSDLRGCVRTDIPGVRDEADDFEKEFTLRVLFTTQSEHVI